MIFVGYAIFAILAAAVGYSMYQVSSKASWAAIKVPVEEWEK